MARGRFLWFGLHLSLAGGLLILFAQLADGADSWSVSASCGDGATVSGSITSPPGSHTIHVAVTYHVPGGSDWLAVSGASATLNVEGAGPHGYGPLDVSATPAEANSIRVEIDVTGDPTNEKSESFKPCRGVTPEPTATDTSTPEPSETVKPSPTQPKETETPRPTPSDTPVPSPSVTEPPAETPSPITEISATVSQPTSTATPMVRGIPSAGSGGLLDQHRTSLTALGVGLIFLGMALVASRGLADARRR